MKVEEHCVLPSIVIGSVESISCTDSIMGTQVHVTENLSV